METNRRCRRTLVVIGAAVALLISLVVVLALLSPREFYPASPEGTTQGYFQAVVDDQEDLALGYFTGASRDRCSTGETLRLTRYAARVVITRNEVDSAGAKLDVKITESYGDSPFDTGSYSFDKTLVLEQHGDRWLIADTPWPFRFYCKEKDQ